MRFIAFIRNYKTRINIMIFILLFLLIIISKGFSDRLILLVNDYYDKYVNLSFISSFDYHNDKLDYSLINYVESSIVVKPIFKDFPLKRSSSDFEASDIFYDYFLLHETDSSLFYIFDISDNMSSGEIVIALPFESLTDEQKNNFSNIINNNMSFVINDKKVNFKIIDIIDSINYSFIISDFDYNLFSKENVYFFNRAFVNDYRNVEDVKNYLNSIFSDDTSNIVLSSSGDWTSNYDLIVIIDILYYIIITFVIFSIILVLNMFNSLIKEFRNDLFIQYVVGFKICSIKINFFLYILFIFSVSFLFSIIISLVLFYLFSLFNIISLHLNIPFIFIFFILLSFFCLIFIIFSNFKKRLLQI